MQVTQDPSGLLDQSFFTGKTEKSVREKMDAHFKGLPGHRLISRTKIGRNEICPCGSGLKFKKCCISKAQ